jgi:hypothetical protein
MTTDQKPQLAIMVTLVLTALIYLATFLNLAWANRRMAASLRMGTLAQMVGEMNDLRQFRADHPDLERELFEGRRTWSTASVQRHLAAVQLANILEWAYVARRNDLIEKDVWESWASTWRDVILESKSLRASFDASVWTFGRSRRVLADLEQLVSTRQAIPDPRGRRGNR